MTGGILGFQEIAIIVITPTECLAYYPNDDL